VRHDRPTRTISSEPGVLVVEDVGSVAHQIGSSVAFERVNAVLARLEKSVEFKITLVVVPDRVVEQQSVTMGQIELRKVAAVTRVRGTGPSRDKVDN
jgi:hypothetical protein